MNYWLLKSEPSTFSIDDLERSPGKRTHWDGVRNYQARNFIRDQMRRGDRAFFYHSSCPEPGIVGIVRVAKEAYPDHTQFDRNDDHYDPNSAPADPRWLMIDVVLERKLSRVITLAALKIHAEKELTGLALLAKGNRLSIMPVCAAHWKFILGME
jgi:predicted RNA-binding protein with PUA-like domain